MSYSMLLQLVDLFLCDDRLSVLRKSQLHLCLGKCNPQFSPGVRTSYPVKKYTASLCWHTALKADLNICLYSFFLLTSILKLAAFFNSRCPATCRISLFRRSCCLLHFLESKLFCCLPHSSIFKKLFTSRSLPGYLPSAAPSGKYR